ncbi:hypothetical protein DPEC_G00107850 [Dallia pectoralis]|uniref:Uncharacterized protein n=1 Tax=Dallia pectoralis TaxID=75939 RepID=A0ACC2GS50_DALPE|nr:hypothetical protein DPEC_G00107850 [Dallia pectoralis]
MNVQSTRQTGEHREQETKRHSLFLRYVTTIQSGLLGHLEDFSTVAEFSFQVNFKILSKEIRCFVRVRAATLTDFVSKDRSESPDPP